MSPDRPLVSRLKYGHVINSNLVSTTLSDMWSLVLCVLGLVILLVYDHSREVYEYQYRDQPFLLGCSLEYATACVQQTIFDQH